MPQSVEAVRRTPTPSPAPRGAEIPRDNPYYKRVSEGYRLAKWATLLFFVGYLIFMLLSHRENITYENFLYLLRDLNFSSGGSGAYTSVVYEEQQNMAFTAFRGEFTVAGSSGVRMFDASGAQILHDSVSYASPCMAAGEKYLLLYDAGGTDFALFTTLACVHRGQADGAIQCAAIADNGTYAVVSRSSEARYIITLYSDSFRRTAQMYRESYVTDVAFSRDGRTLAVLGVTSENWNLSASVAFFTVGEEKTETISLGESLPLRVAPLRGGGWAVITNNALVFLSPDGTSLRRTTFASTTLAAFDASPERIVLVCAENLLGTRSLVLVYNAEGERIFETETEEKLLSVTAPADGGDVFLAYENRVGVWRGGALTEYPYSGRLLALCEIGGTPILCFSGGARAAAALSE